LAEIGIRIDVEHAVFAQRPNGSRKIEVLLSLSAGEVNRDLESESKSKSSTLRSIELTCERWMRPQPDKSRCRS